MQGELILKSETSLVSVKCYFRDLENPPWRKFLRIERFWSADKRWVEKRFAITMKPRLDHVSPSPVNIYIYIYTYTHSHLHKSMLHSPGDGTPGTVPSMVEARIDIRALAQFLSGYQFASQNVLLSEYLHERAMDGRTEIDR